MWMQTLEHLQRSQWKQFDQTFICHLPLALWEQPQQQVLPRTTSAGSPGRQGELPWQSLPRSSSRAALTRRGGGLMSHSSTRAHVLQTEESDSSLCGYRVGGRTPLL